VRNVVFESRETGPARSRAGVAAVFSNVVLTEAVVPIAESHRDSSNRTRFAVCIGNGSEMSSCFSHPSIDADNAMSFASCSP
jgi:hypothetical protein